MVTIVINLLGGLGKLHNLSEPCSSFNKKESQPVPTVVCGLHAFVSAEHLAHCKHSVNGTISSKLICSGCSYMFVTGFLAAITKSIVEAGCLPCRAPAIPGSPVSVSSCWDPSVCLLLSGFLWGKAENRSPLGPARSSAYTFTSNTLTPPHTHKISSHRISYVHLASENHMHTQTH